MMINYASIPFHYWLDYQSSRLQEAQEHAVLAGLGPHSADKIDYPNSRPILH